jgi:hypothetical protein
MRISKPSQSCATWQVLALILSFCTAAPLLAADFTWENAPVSTNWDNPNNWAGPNLQIPDDNTDTALVDTFIGFMPTFTANRILGDLRILNAGFVATGNGINNYSLLVQNNGGQSGSLTVDGFSEQFRARIDIHQSPSAIDLDTDQLFVHDFGLVRIRDGALAQVDQAFRTYSHVSGSGNGEIMGDGILEFGANSFNDGTLSTAPGGTFTVRSTGGAQLDLDGTGGDGHLFTDTNSTLIINAPLSDTLFNGTASINSMSEIQINQAWRLATDGWLHFDGNIAESDGTSTLSGANATLGGNIRVRSGTAILAAAQTIIQDTAAVELFENTTLQFDTLTHVENPNSIQNNVGTTFVVNHDIIIGGLVAGATIGYFDWDGQSQNGLVTGHTIVNPGATMYLNVSGLDSQGLDERYSGRITLNSGRIEVQNSDDQWEMDGILTMRNTANDVPVLSGHTGTQVLITGDVIVEGGGVSRISERSIFGSTSHMDVAANTELELGASQVVNQDGSSTIINGGNWTGAGAVNLDALLTTITAATTVNMPLGTFDLDGNHGGDTVEINARLSLNVASIDDSDNNRVGGTTRINGAGGQLNVQFTNPNRSYIVDGTLELNGPGGGLIGAHLAGADVELRGTTVVSGNSMSHARVDFTGYTDIAAGATFHLNGGSLANPNVVRAGSTYGGSGELIVSTGRSLRAEDGVLIGVDLENRGRFEPGSSTGTVGIDGDFAQAATGVFAFEFAGAPGIDQDLLTVTGDASVDGTLEVKLLGNYVPTAGSVYSVIVADTRLGVFDTLTTLTDSIVDFNAAILYSVDRIRIQITDVSIFGDFDDDLMLDCTDVDALVAEIAAGGMMPQFDLTEDGLINIEDLNEWLSVAGTFNVGGPYLPGDANLDGFVDGSDFGIWNANKFTLDNGWCGADFNADGATDGSDFGIWNANKFTSSVALSVVPEPAGMVSLLLIAAFLPKLRGMARTTTSSSTPKTA